MLLRAVLIISFGTITKYINTTCCGETADILSVVASGTQSIFRVLKSCYVYQFATVKVQFCLTLYFPPGRAVHIQTK
jgi:hypothetical protein